MPKDRFKHGRGKLISNYGGVGSLIDPEHCSVMVETFDKWGYQDLQNKLSKYIIRDDRLLSRLKNIFKNLRHIVQIPTEQSTYIDQIYPTSNYFPKWFYCTKCKKFAQVDKWKRRWSGKADKLYPPVCTTPECKENKLEQVRFVMTCPDGHIDDVPWNHWNILFDDNNGYEEGADDEEQIPKGPRIDLTRTCCENQDLSYSISRENTELSGIFIECKAKGCGNKRNLSSIFNYERPCTGRKYWNGQSNGQFDNEVCGKKMKVVVKSSNSVYYANTISSIYIPEMQSQLDNETRVEIDNMLDSGSMSKNDIIKFFSISKKLPQESIRSYIETGDTSYISDVVFREAEYNYFLKNNPPEDNQIRFRQIDCSNILYGFEKVIRIDKLKKIVVQTSFTRQEPIDVDSILQSDNDYGYAVKRQSISKNNFETRLLPGIECYGEGILFVLDKQKMEKWEAQPQVIERVNGVKKNAESSSWNYHKVIAKSVTPRKILIHTLSHLLMRGLEYVCGYPVVSLSERLYVNYNMQGFLISAFDGTSGYMGGLSTLCNNLERLREIIHLAIDRAKDCSSDPICMESEGQGVSELNLAACHSCSLVPEVSCELSNLFLDRKILIDKKFGYFKKL